MEMETYSFLLLLGAVIVFTYVFFSIKKPANYPPGPFWWSFIGNLPELKKLSRALGGQHLALSALAEKYNTNVLGLKLGKDYVVAVFSYSTVRKVLTSDEYDGRPDNFFIRLRCMGTRKGITCTDGDIWRSQRAFVTTHLKQLGYGKNKMEEMIDKEINEILHSLQEESENIRISNLLSPHILNILWTLTTGTRFSSKDSNLKKLLDLLSARSKTFDISGGTLTQFPWLRHLIPEKIGYNLINNLNAELRAMLMKTIDEHKKNWHEDLNDDLIYSFIGEMKNANGNKSTFTEDQLLMMCLDIFISGSQTTGNLLEFLFMMMILHPDVQNKMHQCLDATFKNFDRISYSDRYKVPYIQAIILEVERMFAVGPISGPRRVLKDTILENFNIPKNTTALISLYSVHYDKEYWGDPEVFRPERFLDENGNFIHSERVLPYALGKRRCLGEVLAKSCLFMFFTQIMMRYKVSITPGTPTPRGVPLPGITLSAEFFKASFTKR